MEYDNVPASHRTGCCFGLTVLLAATVCFLVDGFAYGALYDLRWLQAEQGWHRAVEVTETTTPQPTTTSTKATTTKAGAYRAIIANQGAECAQQAKAFSAEVATAEACDRATAAAPECGMHFMWAEGYAHWGCRCCAVKQALGGPPNPRWAVYHVQSLVPDERLAVPMPPPEKQSPLAPLVGRGRRCLKEEKSLGNHPTVAACAAKARTEKACGGFVMFSFAHPEWSCRCCSAQGADTARVVAHMWDVYRVEGNATHDAFADVERPRFYVVVTTAKKSLERARKMLASLRLRKTALDHFVYVCGAACAPWARATLPDVLEMPEAIVDSLETIPECRSPGTMWICSHRMGAMKFVYGLVHEVRRMQSTGYPMPRWWLVADDDTYWHFPNLFLALNRSLPDGKPLWQGKVSYGNRAKGCPGICGGAGWILSATMAEEIGGKKGQRYIDFSAERIVNHWGYYDVYVPEVVSWTGARLEHLPALQEFSPADENYAQMLKKGELDPVNCSVLPYCKCARSANPASWHVKKSFDQALKLLDAT